MEESLGSKAELKIYLEKYKKDGSKEKVPAQDPGSSPGIGIDEQYAIVLTRVFTDKNILDYTTLAVNSPHILAVLREVVRTEGVPGLFAGLTPRIAKIAPACGIMISCFEVRVIFKAFSPLLVQNLTGFQCRALEKC